MVGETSKTRACGKCRAELPVDEFPGWPQRPQSYCRPCKNAAQAAFGKTPTGITIARRSRLKRAGVNPDDLHGIALVPPPGTTCGICGTETPRGQGSFHLDHDHETGQIRAWCCHDCNTGLGSLKDSPAILASALRYLHKHGRCLSTDDLASLLHLNTS